MSRPSPEEFFAAEQKPTQCKACMHADRELIDAALKNGVTAASVGRWTAKFTTVAVSPDSIRRHAGHLGE